MMHTHGAHARHHPAARPTSPDPDTIVHRAIRPATPPPAPERTGGWATAGILAAVVALLSVYVAAIHAAPTPSATHISRSAAR